MFSKSPGRISTARAGMLALAFAGFGFAGAALADHGREVERGAAEHRGMVLDARYHHDHYYPGRGFAVRALPGGYRSFVYGRDRFYYYGGVWYRPYGPRFVVVAPPIGLAIPFLPDFYTTVWFGGVPYYYANDTYYMWSAQDNGYEVVDTPSGAVNAA